MATNVERIKELTSKIEDLSPEELAELAGLIQAFIDELNDDPDKVVASADLSTLELVASAAEALTNEEKRRDNRRSELAASLRTIEVPADRRPVARNVSQARAVTASGAPLAGADDIAREFSEAVRQGRATDRRGRVVVASVRASGDAPVLSAADRPQVVSARISEAATALVAAGGPGPSPLSYALEGLETAERPIANALPNFVADRAGIRFFRSPGISAANGATDQWTVADDIAALDEAGPRKPSLRFDAPDEVEVQLYAVTQSLTVGRFLDKSFPELVARYVDLTAANHAARAESLLIDGIKAEATAVTVGATDLGGSVSLLTALERAAVVERSSRRLSPDAKFTAILPAWIAPALRADLAAEAGGTFDASDADVNRWLRLRDITPIYSLDYQKLTAQGAGNAVGYPATVNALVFPTGDFAYFDGGTLDLGLIVDSTLVAANDYQTFAETFENVIRFGNSKAIDLTVPFANYGVRRAAA